MYVHIVACIYIVIKNYKCNFYQNVKFITNYFNLQIVVSYFGLKLRSIKVE